MAFFNRKNSDFYKEASILKVSDLVSWKKARNVYNFESLPSTAIISVKKNIFSKVVSPFTKRAKGINGLHYIYKSKFILCSEFGSGSPAMLMLLEELKELGVERFIFLGVAGILSNLVKEGQAYIISTVYSSSGSSFFYTDDEKIDCYDWEWFEKIKTECNLESKFAWSTDCPFREVPSLLSYYKTKACALVEMESAAIFSFSQFYKASAVSILIGADDLTSQQWKVPDNVGQLLAIQQKIVSQLIKQ